MKKNLSLCMAFSLVLGIPGQTHAVTFKERAESIRQKAIAVAKKGGKYSKRLWDKINFMGRATKERKAAEEALEKCRMRSCEAELKKFKEASSLARYVYTDEYADFATRQYREARASLDKCDLLHCRNELKRWGQADEKETLSGVALASLISVATIAAMGGVVGGAVIHDVKAQKRQDKKLAETKLLEELEKELKKIEIETGKTGQSPMYEAPGQ